MPDVKCGDSSFAPPSLEYLPVRFNSNDLFVKSFFFYDIPFESTAAGTLAEALVNEGFVAL